MESLMAKIKAHGNAVKRAISSNNAKRTSRKAKKARVLKGQKKALPKIRAVSIPKNYINPLTHSPMKEAIFYMLTNKGTRRKNYFTRAEIGKLVGRSLTNYQLLMLDPKKQMFRNPITRNPVYARNLQRVRPK